MSHANDLYLAQQNSLRERYAKLISRFDSVAAELGIGENGDGQQVPSKTFRGDPPATRPRFEAKCQIRDGQFVEIEVDDYTVERTGYQTSATIRVGREVAGGTEEARALARELWRRVTAAE